ncbi:MAG TPA: pyridoxal-dependent decarboxylase [Clostridia bacterium]|nr:pyridoxal-dependent decarboxylase [Clostridia bacterium]
MGFDFDRETRRKLGYRLIDHINDYFSSLPHRPVQLPLEKRTFGQLGDRLPEFGEDAELVLDELCFEMTNKGFHVPSANYFGLMNPTPTYMAVLAEALVAALNPQLATLARSQLASKIESETVRWIAERVGWRNVSGSEKSCGSERKSCDGTFTSGGNEANFTALALAIASRFPRAVDEGVATIGARAIAYASWESHHSLDKSMGLLGLGRKSLRRIAVDQRIQMDVAKLEAAIREDLAAGHKPFCVIATAGTTNSGAIDEIHALADICQRYGLWLHVDGAYGAAAIFSDAHRDLVSGIERADSITIDPHKWLAMPFAAGVVLTSHPELLQQAFAIATPYMPTLARSSSATPSPNLVDNFKISAQWSRRMNSLKLWLTLRVHGRHAYEELIDRQLKLARNFADWIAQSDEFELIATPQLPIVNFRVKVGEDEAETATANAALVDAVTRDGRQWISQTVVNGRSVVRMMVISYLSDEYNLEQLKQALTTAVRAIAPAKTSA